MNFKDYFRFNMSLYKIKVVGKVIAYLAYDL